MTFLWYVVHLCNRSFTYVFIHYILCFMWLGFSHLFSYKCMYVGGVNFTSLLFMNVYSIYTFIVWCLQKGRKIKFMSLLFVPLCWWIDKKGERYFGVWYMHVCLCMFVYMHVCYIYHWYKKLLLLVLVSRTSFVVLLVSRAFIGI